MNAVQVVRPTQARYAKYYEDELAAFADIAIFVSVNPVVGSENEFTIFVGGPRKYPEEALAIAVQGVLNERRARHEARAFHAFELKVCNGITGARPAVYPAEARAAFLRDVSRLQEPENEAAEG